MYRKVRHMTSSTIICLSTEYSSSNNVVCIDDISVEYARSVCELFSILCDTCKLYSMILIDLNCIVNSEYYSVISAIKTILTSKSAIFPVAIIVDYSSDLRAVKQLLRYDIGGVLPIGDICSSIDTEVAAKTIINGNTFNAELILKKLKSSKSVVISNGISLTTRQKEIYSLIISRGMGNKLIARCLGLSESTVKLHVSSILKKYGVRNRTQLVACQNTKK